MTISAGKLKHLKALSNARGVIAAAAMDQRASLQKSIATARGCDQKDITQEMMEEFKTAVSKALTPHASAILLDPEYGLPAARARSSNAGLLLAYEESGYDNTKQGRLPDLLPHVSVKRLIDWGANAVKILLYYTPFDPVEVNDIKHAFIERVGAESEQYHVPFFLECVGYDHEGKNEKTVEFAQKKPAVVGGSMLEFSKPQYKVDVLKMEVPVNMEFVEGTASFKGAKAYSRAEALQHFRDSAALTKLPFIYLSAGVGNSQFVETLAMAGESGAEFNGVLCGRATWKDGMPIYGKGGVKALEDWLAKDGVANIEAVNQALSAATPWAKKVGAAA
jgi:tagatose 1,6-diphosphate aldolase